MTITPEHQRDLTILEKIEQNPDETQASLAKQLGVAVGTINWHLKRLISKGYVKVRRAERRKLLYIITPEGISLRARLTIDFVQTSFGMYRLVRERVNDAVDELRATGCERVRLIGDGDVADVCRLTCLERDIEVVEDEDAPAFRIQGLKILFEDQAEISPENRIIQPEK